jgi:hypothetical protein
MQKPLPHALKNNQITIAKTILKSFLFSPFMCEKKSSLSKFLSLFQSNQRATHQNLKKFSKHFNMMSPS